MTDEHATFLKAIIARPDLDLPRLVYADWLEGTAGQKPCPACPELGYGNEPEWTTEIPLYWCGQCDQATRSVPNGHAERAEFIRVQVELVRMPNCGHEAGWQEQPKLCKGCAAGAPALRRRERELWSAHGETWFGTEFTATGWVTLENVRRGFMESVEMPWPDFRTHADAIRKATPLRRVRLTTWSDDVMEELSAARFSGIEFELPRRAVVLTA
jgi:uncharacterized protein (TIGR02996 family)